MLHAFLLSALCTKALKSRVYVFTLTACLKCSKATCGQRLWCWPGRPWTSTILSKMSRTTDLNFESLWDDLVR